MTSAPHTPDIHHTPATPDGELGIRAGSDPSTTQRVPPDSRSPQDTKRTGTPSYFGKLTKPALQRLNGAAVDEDDETGSTITELSNTAQAGSVAPSSPGSPIAESTEDERERSDGVDEDKDSEMPDADASPFWNQNHDSAKMPEPPKINLTARTHPLAGGDAEHGNVPLCEDVQANMDDERAEGTLSPAYNDAVEFKPSEEDPYSSDEAKEEESTTKRLANRVKERTKVISGQIRRIKEG
ncbi:hypothetical protein C8R45DRAFT_989495 [Mycena sanguinolenta]|nr:hypothetical protein C8R45DRAFT_989495 [Mycena sanguinolenta]